MRRGGGSGGGGGGGSVIGWVVVAWTPTFNSSGVPIQQSLTGYVFNGAGDSSPGVWNTIDRAVAACGVVTIYNGLYGTTPMAFGVLYANGTGALPTYTAIPNLPTVWPFTIKNAANTFTIWTLPWATMPTNPGVVVPPPGTVGTVIQLQSDGTDWGARINSADTTLGAVTGTIVISGDGPISTQAIISGNHTLMIAANTKLTNSVNDSAILLKDNAILQGYDWSSIITESSFFTVQGTKPSFIVRSYNEYQLGSNQCTNIKVRNLQFSGLERPSAPNDGIAATVISGLLNGGSYTGLWFNRTHAIGLTIGQSNTQQTMVCQNITVGANLFTNVGGGKPPNFTGGGGVSFALVNGQTSTFNNMVFVDPLGNTAMDFEPNTQFDPMTDLTCSGNIITCFGSTGIKEPSVLGIVTHNNGGATSGNSIDHNVVAGGYSGSTLGNGMLDGIHIGYGPTNPDTGFTVSTNLVRFTQGNPIILDKCASCTMQNNNCFWSSGPAFNMNVRGHGQTVSGNSGTNPALAGAYFMGIEEAGYYIQTPTWTPNTTGGSLATNTYFITVTTVDSAGHETDAPFEDDIGGTVAVTGPNGSIVGTWSWPTALFGSAAKWRVYIGTTKGAESTFFETTVTSITLTSLSGTSGTPPTQNTSTVIGPYSNTFTNNSAAGCSSDHDHVVHNVSDASPTCAACPVVLLISTNSSQSGSTQLSRPSWP